MKILPFKMMKVAEGLWVKVPNHFFYSDFGIRDAGEMRYSGRRYIMGANPGTGFIERESESHSYHQFVRNRIAQQKPSYWRMLTGKEPDFSKTLAEANKALRESSGADPLKRQILECYVNALTVANREERFERIIRAIKNKMGHHSNKYLVSVMSHYKNRIRQMENDMRSVVLHVEDTCSPESFAVYTKMVEAYTHVASCRRVWLYDETKRDRYRQVFLDLGVFDYIRSDCYLPMLRDDRGVEYYFLPTALIIARSHVDFDVRPLKDLTVVCQELAIEEPTEALLSRIGDAASMIKIPELNLNYYFNHVRYIVNFVHALDELKATL